MMLKPLMSFAFAALALILVAPVAAQEQPPPLEPGTRVRVTAAGSGIRNHVGTLRVLNADSVVLEDGLMLPLAFVTQLDLSRGRKSRAGRGALIGLGIGAGLGAVLGFAVSKDESYENSCRGFEAQCTAAGAVILGLPGLGLGALFGALIKTDRWEKVPLDRLRVSIGPQRDGGFGLGLSVRF